jgi:carbon storage regulator
MLGLTRKVGQRIRIGDDIVVEVEQIRGSYVKLGIEAPREVPILRDDAADESGRKEG